MVLANPTAERHYSRETYGFRMAVTVDMGECLIKPSTPETVHLHEPEDHSDPASCGDGLLLSWPQPRSGVPVIAQRCLEEWLARSTGSRESA